MSRFWTTLIAVLATALVTTSAVAQSPVVDGFVKDPVTGEVEAPYVLKGITYTQDQATGLFSGYLYMAEDADELFFGFAQSTGISDNSYGVNGIDWDFKKQGHRLSDLLRSDHAKVRLYDCTGTLSMEFFLDYATEDKKTNDVFCLGATGGDGAMYTGDPAHITAAGSSLAWDHMLASPEWPDQWNSSPQRVPTNTYDPGTSADPDFPWIYEQVYEWSIAKAAFADGCFGGIEILEVHNSPLKSANNPVPVPILTVSKEADPPSGSTVLDGDEILFTISYSNPGFVALSDVTITDVIDDNLTNIVPLNGGVYDEATRTITWPTIAVIGAGLSGHVQFTATVTPLTPAETAIYNTAVFTSPNLQTPAETNTTVHYIQHSPDLAVTKSCPAELNSGGQATYVITVENLGFGTAESVSLVDVLPAEVAFASATPAPTSVDGQTVTFDLGAIAFSQSVEVTIIADVIAGSGIANNTATASTPTVEGGQGQANNSDSCVSALTGADVYVFKQCPAEMQAGTQATYIVEGGNSGTADALAVSVVDVLPAGVTFVSATPAPSSVNGQELTFDLGDLSSGQVVFININVDADLTIGSATNSVSISTTVSEGGEGAANNSSECASQFTAPDIAVDKTCPIDMIAGQSAAYTLNVTNSGTAAAAAVELVDTLPAGVSFVSATPAPLSVVDNELTFALGDLAAGGSILVTINVSVDATAGSADNSATVSTTSVEGGQVDANNSDSCTSTFKAPDLAVTKSCPVDTVAGEQASYVIGVDNLGNADALNVVIVDTLPAGVSFVSATPTPTSVVGNIITFSPGNLAAGASAQITLDVLVSATSGAGTNSVAGTTDSTEGGQGSANNSDSCSSNFLAPDVAISKSCPVDMIAGENDQYDLLVSNLGSYTAYNVVVTDTLPAGVSFISALPAPISVAGNVITFDLGDLAASANSAITVQVSVDATSGTALNQAAVSTDSVEGGADGANNSDSCSSNLLSADISVDKSCPIDMTAGEAASYTLTVANNGTATAKGVTLVDTLPTGVTYTGASPAPLSVVGNVVTFDLGDLAPGASLQITIGVVADATSGAATNAASVFTSTVEGGAGAADNDDSCSSNFLAPDLAIDKTCPADMVAGENAIFTIAIDNLGTATAKNVIVTDTLPEGVTFLSAVPAPTSVAGQAVTFELGDIAEGSGLVISLEVFVDSTSGSGTNSASGSTDSVEGGLAAANNIDSCASGFLAPDIALAKTCPVDMIAGDPASYSLTVSNLGDTDALNVVVTDILPVGVSFVSALPAPASIVGQTLTFSVGDIAPGANTAIDIQVLAASTSGTATNNATSSTDSVEGGQASANNDASCSSNFLSPDVAVAKTCPIDMIAGTGSSYTVAVSNLGNTDARNVVVIDTLPAGVSLVDATPAPALVDGQALTFNLGDMAPGASLDITINVSVDATSGTATNSASAATDSVEGGEGSANNDDSCTSNFLSPDVELTKTCPIDMVAGEAAGYDLLVSNLGNTDALNVVVTDTLPDGLSFVSAIPAPALVDGQTLTFNLGDLAPDAGTAIAITVIPVATSGTVTNNASAATDSVEGGLAAANNDDACSSDILSPDVAIAADCPIDMVAGEAAVYTLTITNLGNTGAHDVIVTDILPDGVTFVGALPAPASVAGQVLTFNLGELAAGASTVITIDVVADSTAGTGDNTASVSTSSVEGGAAGANNSAACSSNYLSPDLALDKTCPADMTAGENAVFTVAIDNLGTSTATNVVVTDTLPDGVVFVSAVPAPTTVSGQDVVFELGDLAAGAGTVITINVAVESTSGSGINTAFATTDSVEGGLGAANNTDSCASGFQAPDIALDKTCPVDMIAGDNASYSLTVANQGTTDALNVVVTDTLPAGVSFVSALPAPTTINGQTLAFAVGDLVPGASAVIEIQVLAVSTSGTATNSATSSTDSVEGGAGAANNDDSCSSNFLSPDVAVAKTCPIDMIAGTGSNYTVAVSNLGNTDARNVVVIDTLPAGVSFVDATPAPVLVDGQTLTFNLGDMAAGASLDIAINVSVDATSGTGSNSVSATTDSVEGGLGAANNDDSCSSNFLSPDVELTKSCPVDMIAGEGAAYDLLVSNLGNTDALNVVLTDTLPAGVSFVSAVPAPSLVDGQTLTFNLGDMAASASIAITINVLAESTSGTAVNAATAATDSVEGGEGSANNDDSCSSNFIAPDLVVAKTCPIDMIAGKPAGYTVSVSNAGTSPALNVVIVDTLPAGVTYVAATPAPASVVGQVITFNLGDLAVGASLDIVIDVSVEATSGTGTNSAAGTTDSVEGGLGSANNDDSCSSNFLSADVRLEKDCLPGSVVANNDYTLVTRFYNDGTSDAEGVMVVETVPAGLFEGDVFSATSTLGLVTIDGLTVTVDAGTMAPGTMGLIEITGTVTASTGARGDYLSEAIITTTSEQLSATDDAENCTITVLSPILETSKASVVSQVSANFTNTVLASTDEVVETAAASKTDSAVIASRLEYTITVTNTGDAPASNVDVVDSLPAGAKVVANPDNAILAGSTATWTVPSLAAGASAQFSLTLETLNQ